MNLFKKDQLNLKQFSLDQDQKKYSILDYNFKLFFLIIAAMAMGTVIIVSVDETKLTKQLIGAGVCILGMIIVSLIDYNFICKYYMVLYAANIVLLGLVLVVGSGADSHGASRWFQISDSFTIQPSEFAKIILIICTAVFLEKHADDLNTAKTLLKLAAFLAIPIGLIFAEPDLSTTICICATLFITQDNRYCGTDTHTILWRLLLVYPAGQPASVSERISETAYTWTYVWRRIHPGSAEQLDHGHRIGTVDR